MCQFLAGNSLAKALAANGKRLALDCSGVRDVCRAYKGGGYQQSDFQRILAIGGLSSFFFRLKSELPSELTTHQLHIFTTMLTLEFFSFWQLKMPRLLTAIPCSVISCARPENARKMGAGRRGVLIGVCHRMALVWSTPCPNPHTNTPQSLPVGA